MLPPLPGLDGLRGLAVLAVVAYHSGFGWARGGWLGVSAFFTLSGYLITTLLLAEVARDGRVSWRAFGGRRARRLLPALLATVAGVVVVGRWVTLPSALAHLRGDAWATLGQVANWHFLIRGEGYGAQFTSPSPLLHTWSLSIEAQAYVLLPVAVLVAAWVARRASRLRARGTDGAVTAVAVALGLLLAGSLAAGAVLAESGVSLDRLYFGTDVRLAELLAGSVLAVVLWHRPVARASGEARQALDMAGLVALAVGVVLWAATDQATRSFYPVGLWAHAAGAAVVVAAVRAEGVTARVLSLGPLRSVGRLSYGIYLYHWPIFTWLTPERSGWPEPAVHATRLGLTFALAVLSLRLLEEPIRRQRRAVLRSRPLAPVGVAVVAALALTVTPPAPEERLDVAAAIDEFEQLATVTTSAPTTTGPVPVDSVPPVDVEDLPPPRVAVVGDSTAILIGVGLARWSEAEGRIEMLPGFSKSGCGLLQAGEHRVETAPLEASEAPCAPWADVLTTSPGANVAVVAFGPWDLAEHRLPGGEWSHLGRPDVDEAMREAIDDLARTLIAAGMAVVWLLPPRVTIGASDGVPPAEEDPASSPERLARFRSLIRDVAADHPGQMTTPDLRTWLRTRPGGEMDVATRPDGLHIMPEAAQEMARDWLGDQLIEAAARFDAEP